MTPLYLAALATVLCGFAIVLVSAHIAVSFAGSATVFLATPLGTSAPYVWEYQVAANCGSRGALSTNVSLSVVPGMATSGAGYNTIVAFLSNSGGALAAFGHDGNQQVNRLQVPYTRIRIRSADVQPNSSTINVSLSCRSECPSGKEIVSDWDTQVAELPGGMLPCYSIRCPYENASVEVQSAQLGSPAITVLSNSTRQLSSGSVISFGRQLDLLVVTPVEVSHRCVFAAWPCGSAICPPLRLPAMVLSDVDGAGEESWMSYPDTAAIQEWSFVNGSSGPCATFESPMLEYLALSVQPNMQDTTWGSPGYRTILSFVDNLGRVLAAFGHNGSQRLANVTLPGLAKVRLRVMQYQSAFGFDLRLSCVKQFSSTISEDISSGLTTWSRVALQPLMQYQFTCGTNPLHVRAVELRWVNGTTDQLVVLRGVGPPITRGSVFGTVIDVVVSATALVEHRCSAFALPCGASLGTCPTISLPATIVSDLDGANGVSWLSYPDTLTPSEWTIDTSSCTSSKGLLVLDYLTFAVQGNMKDSTWGTSGYRTILSFLDTVGVGTVAAFGDNATLAIENVSLPNVTRVRLRVFPFNSAPGFEFRIACAPPPNNGTVEVLSNQTDAGAVALAGGQTYAFRCGNGSSSTAPWSPVLTGLTSADTPLVQGGSIAADGVIYGTPAAPLLVTLPASLGFTVNVRLQCMHVLHYPCKRCWWSQARVSPPLTILSDLDGAGTTSWLSYPDAASTTEWLVDGNGTCDATSEVLALTYLRLFVQPNMQDGTWGTPGYRTILSFLDSAGTVLAAFGDSAQQTVGGVISLPNVALVRLRVFQYQSAPGFEMRLECVNRNLSKCTPFTTDSFDELQLAHLRGGFCYVMACTSDSGGTGRSKAVVELYGVDTAIVQVVGGTRTAGNGAVFSLNSSSVTLAPPAGIDVRFRCSRLFLPCNGASCPEVQLPATILSDIDGASGESWLSYPDTPSFLTWTINNLCPVGTVLMLRYLNLSVQPNMQDFTYASPGYRTILSFHSGHPVGQNAGSNSDVLAAFGNLKNQVVHNLSLSTLRSVQLSIYPFQSQQGFEMRLECAALCDAGLSSSVVLRKSVDRKTITMLLLPETCLITACLGDRRVLLRVSDSASATTVGASRFLPGVGNMAYSVGYSLSVRSAMPQNITLWCAYVYSSSCHGDTSVKLPALVVSDTDGPGSESWVPYYSGNPLTCRFVVETSVKWLRTLRAFAVTTSIQGGYTARFFNSTTSAVLGGLWDSRVNDSIIDGNFTFDPNNITANGFPRLAAGISITATLPRSTPGIVLLLSRGVVAQREQFLLSASRTLASESASWPLSLTTAKPEQTTSPRIAASPTATVALAARSLSGTLSSSLPAATVSRSALATATPLAQSTVGRPVGLQHTTVVVAKTAVIASVLGSNPTSSALAARVLMVTDVLECDLSVTEDVDGAPSVYNLFSLSIGPSAVGASARGAVVGNLVFVCAAFVGVTMIAVVITVAVVNEPEFTFRDGWVLVRMPGVMCSLVSAVMQPTVTPAVQLFSLRSAPAADIPIGLFGLAAVLAYVAWVAKRLLWKFPAICVPRTQRKSLRIATGDKGLLESSSTSPLADPPATAGGEPSRRHADGIDSAASRIPVRASVLWERWMEPTHRWRPAAEDSRPSAAVVEHFLRCTGPLFEDFQWRPYPLLDIGVSVALGVLAGLPKSYNICLMQAIAMLLAYGSQLLVLLVLRAITVRMDFYLQALCRFVGVTAAVGLIWHFIVENQRSSGSNEADASRAMVEYCGFLMSILSCILAFVDTLQRVVGIWRFLREVVHRRRQMRISGFGKALSEMVLSAAFHIADEELVLDSAKAERRSQASLQHDSLLLPHPPSPDSVRESSTESSSETSSPSALSFAAVFPMQEGEAGRRATAGDGVYLHLEHTAEDAHSGAWAERLTDLQRAYADVAAERSSSDLAWL